MISAMKRRPRNLLVPLLLALGAVSTACRSDEPDVAVGRDAGRAPGLVATVASYDLVAGRPGRFLVGVLAADREKVAAYGAVDLAFEFRGTKAAPAPRQPGPRATARFLPLPGQRLDLATPGPRLVEGSEAMGVYAAQGVGFDRAGFWQVTVRTTLDGRPQEATAAFEVLERSALPAPGSPAPRTDSPVAAASMVPPRALDSRAGPSGPVPDMELHSTSVNAALAARRPVMVVVSTPTYCQSRFCGPVTDSVQALARRYGDRMAFVHLEVWEDFGAGKLNPWAEEWIRPTRSGDAQEPWVFVVGADGVVKERYDNVASDDELEQAVRRMVG